MAGAVKHMERSHKTRNKNYSEFRRFEANALTKNALKKTHVQKKTVFERLKSLFSRKHQDR